MDSSGRWGFRASAALGILCVALLAANFLLPYLSSPAPTSEPASASRTIQSDVASSVTPTQADVGTTSSKRPVEARPQRVALASSIVADHRPPLHKATGEILESQLETREAPKTKTADSALADPIQNPKSEVANLIKPLGVIEKADGRVQAVIENGEWVELVEEGQVLADNRRVVRISADGVELAPPDAGPRVELAHAAPPPEPSAGKAPAREPSRAAVPAVDVVAAFRPTRRDVRAVAAAGGEQSLAVATLDVRRGDDEGNRLPLPQSAEGPAQRPATEPRETVRPAPPAEAPVARIEAAQNPEFGIQNSLQPIGLVEWADGRAEAVVADGDFIEFADNERVLAEARRIPVTLPAAEAPDDGSALQARDAPMLRQEEEMAALALSEEVERPPPEVEQAVLGQPDARARGEPEEVAAANSRPPPFHSLGDGLWEADLPGLEEPTNATTGNFEATVRASFEINRGTPQALRRSVPEEQVAGRSVLDELSKLAPSWIEPPLQTQVVGTRIVRPLGIVEWPDGRVQAVIADGEWVQLVEEGQRLSDGSIVGRVTRQAVVLERAAAGADGSSARGGGTAAGTQHLTDQHSPSGLHLSRAMQDNRTQSRE
ncbi:MAG: hypothetical protein ABSG54_06980 [Terriglobia bacterium]|jgi:hypothetical protein